MLEMSPDEVLAAAQANDANTAEALKAAQDAAASLAALQGGSLFGSSPEGARTGTVFDRASTVIGDLVTEVDLAIGVLSRNLHLSVDNVVKGQEAAQVDFEKLAHDNRRHVETLGTTGIQPGDESYQAPGTLPALPTDGASQAPAN